MDYSMIFIRCYYKISFIIELDLDLNIYFRNKHKVYLKQKLKFVI